MTQPTDPSDLAAPEPDESPIPGSCGAGWATPCARGSAGSWWAAVPC